MNETWIVDLMARDDYRNCNSVHFATEEEALEFMKTIREAEVYMFPVGHYKLRDEPFTVQEALGEFIDCDVCGEPRLNYPEECCPDED
jgi:hypothetical protein